MAVVTLRAGLRPMPLTDPLIRGDVDAGRLDLQLCGATPYTETFRLMARGLAYDIAEMPVATHLLAIDAGKPLAAMPIVLAGGGLPHAALLCLSDSDIDGPAALRGKRVGIRAYAQTTGVWIRGLLQHDYGIAPDEVKWLTTEDSHVLSFRDPEYVARVEDPDLLALLRRREVDAIIASPHVIKEAMDLRTVIPDAQKAAREWAAREQVQGVNHVLSVQRRQLEAHPWLGEELAHRFTAAREWAQRHNETGKPLPAFGDAANRHPVNLMLRYAHEQNLTSRLYDYDELFIAWPQSVTADSKLD